MVCEYLIQMRRFRTRRGLSSIVTSAILLAATVVMGTGLVNWSNTNLSVFQSSLSNTYTTNVNKLNEDLVIENVWFGNNPSKFLNMTISNTGTVGLNVTAIKINDTTNIVNLSFTNSGILPKQQNSTKIAYDWQSKEPLQITVTTSRGSSFTSQVMSP